MKAIAQQLHQAARNAKTVPQFNLGDGHSLDDVYNIQKESIALRIAESESLVGMKLGFTSKAKMEQMGVHDMIWGQLTDAMSIQDKASIQMSAYIHPRAEPEIAFRLSQDVSEQVDIEGAKKIVDGLAVAIELIDSRYENFKFSLEDVIADNCSSSGFAVGEWKSPDTNIQDISMQLSIDEHIAQDGNSNAILGNPWESLVNAVRLALANGISLQKGMIILAGAATSAEFIKAGQRIKASATGLGSVEFLVAS